MTHKKFFAVMFILLALVFMCSGCGGGGDQAGINGYSDNPGQDDPDQDDPTPTPTPGSSFIVTFDSMGGSLIASQEVSKGGTATEPQEEPEKGELYFLGWYTGKGFSFPFDFASEISRDITLYAKWYDENDTIDTDGDGLTDSTEAVFGTDPTNPDTDDDGLTDYDEISVLDYNPLVKDTNGDGVEDGDEDADGDGLTNIQEGNFGTSMITADSDQDRLSDYDEVMTYKTDPLKKDTDGDGVNDGTEIDIGTDPLTPNTIFPTALGSNRVARGDTEAVDISVKVSSDAKGAGTLEITKADITDNPLISAQIPGFLNTVYNISSDGSFDIAEVSFTIGSGVGTPSETFQPRIYYINEETGLLEEVSNQRIEGGKIIAEVTHFSTYILLNKVDFDEVWSKDIRPPSSSQSFDKDPALDIVFVIDRSGSMSWNDSEKLALKLPQEFIDKLRDNKDKAAAVSFASSATIEFDLTFDKTSLKSKIANIYYSGGTDGTTGIKAALDILDNSTAGYKYIIFLTDGEDNSWTQYSYDDLLVRANDNGIVIYTIGMGSAVETTLRKIASSTGGIYYKATTGTATDDILSLDKVYDDIQQEVVDLTADSNHDGITDYHTALIEDGTLRLSNGSAMFAGAFSFYDTTVRSADWDGDGLLNGEELVLKRDKSGNVYIHMASNPLLVDSDADGYTDYQEVKQMKTNPLKKTKLYPVRKITDDSYFTDEKVIKYLDYSTNDHLTLLFEGRRKKQAKNALINYFADYTTTEAIARDAEVATRMQNLKYWMDGIDMLSGVVSLTKSAFDLAADIGSGANNKASFDAVTADRIKNAAREGTYTTFRYWSAISSDVGVINELARVNNNAVTNLAQGAEFLVSYDLSGKNSASWGLYTSVKDTIKTIQNLSDDLGKAQTPAGTLNVFIGLGKKIVSDISALNTINKTFTKFEIPIKWKFAENYKVFSGTEIFTLGRDKFGDEIKYTKGDLVGAAFTVGTNLLNTASNVLKLVETYGKIEANFAEYQKYMDVLLTIQDGNHPSYIKGAASDITGMFSWNEETQKYDPDWEEFHSMVVRAAIGEAVTGVAKTLLDVGESILSKAHPVIGFAVTVAKKGYEVSGLKERGKTIIDAQMYYAILDGSRQLLEKLFTYNGSNYIEYDDYDDDNITKYSLQSAQSRVAGLARVREYLLLDGKLASWLSRGGKWFSGDEEAKEVIKREYLVATVDVIAAATTECGLNLANGIIELMIQMRDSLASSL